MKSLLHALSNTPTWVYFLLTYLIIVGIKASQTRVISLKRLFVIPVLFTYLSIQTLLTTFNIQVLEISAWSGSILIGTLFGWIEVNKNSTSFRVDKTNHLIEIPGGWTTLTLIFIIFISKYYLNYELAVDPTLSKQTWFEFSMLGISGICTGLFIGRLLAYLYHYNKSEHTDLLTKI